ncbi:LamG domain-containing protein [Escherichia coli]|nr:LamG domain-containing protein [Escherichia coli]
MNEMLMLGQAKAKAGLDIDFEDAEIGSTTIVDKNGHPFTLVGTIATGGGVVEDPEVGKCFYFPGTGYFETPMVKDLQLAGVPVMIEAVFKWDGAAGGSIWETGNYPSGRPPTPGICLSVGQYPATYIQYFMMYTNGSWGRGLPPATTFTGEWETVTFQRSNDGTGPMVVYRDGAEFSRVALGPSPIGNGSKLSVGGSYTYGAYWKGRLKSLKITPL